MARPLAAHGTYGRANGSPGLRPPCYCEPCVLIKRKVRKRSEVNRKMGRSARIDAQPAREHITLLHQTMTWSRLAAATGVDDRTLCLIYRGERTRIARSTHARIVAVRPPEQAVDTMYVDATGTIRRVRALMAVGYSGRAIADAANSTDARIQRIASGVQPMVRAGLAKRVARAYRALAFQPVPHNQFTARARNRAARMGWDGPFAWGDTIDDPAAEPERDEPVKAERKRHGTADPERVMELTRQGRTAYEIALDLGVHERTVVRIRGRARDNAAAEQAAA